ncbi:hypothetical protein BGT96224_4611 [Blumeria graminis f. sp. tritici 96224]|nr:hypothetical protein BGT96224_4611 [Blumeria graminis f. sp. tritici 96224]
MITNTRRLIGLKPAKQLMRYSSYKSPHGPKYAVQPNIGGFTLKQAKTLGITLGGFGGVAGFFALFFLGDVPRVRKDILEKVPFIGSHFKKEIPASDNVSQLAPRSSHLSPEKIQYGGSPRFYEQSIKASAPERLDLRASSLDTESWRSSRIIQTF